MAKQERIEQAAVCREIGARTGGDILIGVVGPVRTGKSTLIKQFMEKLVLPAIGPEDAKLRARDELPQSAAGRTIMTTEPKFIPESAVPLALEGGGECSIRLIDCVGYMVEGAMGHEENDKPRMVKSPWFDEEIPFDLAAETGTRKVIRDHSTIGIVVTTDGTISEIPRENYIPAEKRVIDELEALGKPFVIPIVAFYVMKKKNLDDNSNVEISRKKQWILCAVCSLAVGCYDGFYGPGTGTFLLILYTGVAKLPVAKASGTMKLANLSSNIMALVVFLFSGKIVIYLGLAASVFSIAGHYVGSGMVMKNGNKIVRPIILIVLVLLFIKIITGM